MSGPRLDLDELAVRVRRPDDDARAAARAAGPAGTGRLADVVEWLAGVQGRADPVPPARPRLVVLAEAVPGRTGTVAADIGVDVRRLDRLGTVPIDLPACGTAEEALAGLYAGATHADEAADAGTDLLLLALPGPDLVLPAAALIGLLTRSDAAAVTPAGLAGVDDAAWMRAAATIRDAMRRGRPHLADHPALLAMVAGPDLAFATGVLLQAAARCTPVVLDGPVCTAAALVAARLSFRAPGWWLPGGVSPDPAHRLALERLDLEPVLDLGLAGDDGTTALLAVPVLRAALA